MWQPGMRRCSASVIIAGTSRSSTPWPAAAMGSRDGRGHTQMLHLKHQVSALEQALHGDALTLLDHYKCIPHRGVIAGAAASRAIMERLDGIDIRAAILAAMRTH